MLLNIKIRDIFLYLIDAFFECIEVPLYSYECVITELASMLISVLDYITYFDYCNDDNRGQSCNYKEIRF